MLSKTTFIGLGVLVVRVPRAKPTHSLRLGTKKLRHSWSKCLARLTKKSRQSFKPWRDHDLEVVVVAVVVEEEDIMVVVAAAEVEVIWVEEAVAVVADMGAADTVEVEVAEVALAAAAVEVGVVLIKFVGMLSFVFLLEHQQAFGI
mmetsp:Transcript_10332/g.29427  ORF Transcript_10332/g.29427 Transcript_10332/m.29427 type:complete len:146 (+) Transcript_10332:1473-1910(+)